jgi:hypothetical protein
VVGAALNTVVLRPLVHGVSPITTKVHWIESSHLGNQPKIPIKGNPANAGAKFRDFLGLFGPGKLIVTVTDLDWFSSQISVTRHLN